MLLLDGKLVAKSVRDVTALRAQEFKAKYGRSPGLGVIIVGDDPASHIYVKNKETACAQVGFHSLRVQLPASITESELLAEIKQMNQRSEVDAFLVQLPVPKHIRTEVILDAIDPMKDADGLHPVNLGLLWANRMRVAPCTPWGVMRILQHYNISVSGKSCVVVGRSQIVGRPMAHLLSQADGTVTICHSKTPNLSELTRKADVVVVAAGKRAFLGREDFNENSIVIDVGIHGSGTGSGVCGDVRFSEIKDFVKAATPVPGGVGPMTIACLLENTMTLSELRQKQ
jgi:methylenetetrahydrofolate dehydrogenase (NADP+)/methenyltetrahydrofolate cyclohydrolase